MHVQLSGLSLEDGGVMKRHVYILSIADHVACKNN